MTPDISVIPVPNYDGVYVDIRPSPDRKRLMGLRGWLGHIPGVISIETPSTGSLMVRTANPLFPLEKLGENAKYMAYNYFKSPDVSDDAVAGDGDRKIIDALIWERDLAASKGFRAERFAARESGKLDLCIGMNRPLNDEQRAVDICYKLTAGVAAVYLARTVDQGYNLQLDLKDFLGSHIAKDEVAEEVVSYISEYNISRHVTKLTVI